MHICSDGYGFEILTLGDPTRWRRIPGPFQESCERPFNAETFQWSDPVSLHGEILHWQVDSNEYVVSMSMHDEKTYRTHFPDIGQEIEKDKYKLLEMGGCLAFVYKFSSTKISVWILEEWNKEERWVKRHSMVAESVKYCPDSNSSSSSSSMTTSTECNPLPDFMKLFPVATLRGVIFFMHRYDKYVSRWLYFYDVRKMELKKFNLGIKDNSSFMPHTSNSLIHW